MTEYREAYGMAALEVKHEAEEQQPALRYSVSVVLINAATGDERVFSYESDSDSLCEMFDRVRDAGYSSVWGVHESFVTDRADCPF